MYTLNIDGGYSINFCITEEIDDKTIKKIERICNKISKAHTEDLKTLTLVRTQSGQKRGIVENLFKDILRYHSADHTDIDISFEFKFCSKTV